MPTIVINTLHDILGGTEGTGASLTAAVYRGHTPAIRITDSDVIFPTPFTIIFDEDGVPDNPVVLESLPPDCYYQIVIASETYTAPRINAILPIGAGPFNLDELVIVNPTTSIPIPGTSLGDAFLAEIQAYADAALAAELAAEAAAASILPGDGTFSFAFEWSPSSASSLWTIPVPAEMGRRPSVTLYSSTGELIGGADIQADDSIVTVTFPAPYLGTAVLT